MIELELTTWERVQLYAVLGAQRGDVALIRRLIKVLDMLELTDDEKEAVGYEDISAGAAKWEKRDHIFIIMLEKEQFNLLVEIAKDFKDWPASRFVVDLFDKLEAAK